MSIADCAASLFAAFVAFQHSPPPKRSEQGCLPCPANLPHPLHPVHPREIAATRPFRGRACPSYHGSGCEASASTRTIRRAWERSVPECPDMSRFVWSRREAYMARGPDLRSGVAHNGAQWPSLVRRSAWYTPARGAGRGGARWTTPAASAVNGSLGYVRYDKPRPRLAAGRGAAYTARTERMSAGGHHHGRG